MKHPSQDFPANKPRLKGKQTNTATTRAINNVATSTSRRIGFSPAFVVAKWLGIFLSPRRSGRDDHVAAAYHLTMPADCTDQPTALDGRLKAASLKRTPVRLAVLALLDKALKPLDAADVLAGLPDDTDAVTVYRTLNTFVEKKLIHRVRGENRSWQYALGEGGPAADHHHAHFVCDDCGTVECIDEAPLPQKALDRLAPAAGYVVAYPEITLHGTCPKCK